MCTWSIVLFSVGDELPEPYAQTNDMLLRAGEKVVVSKLDADKPFFFVPAEVDSQTKVDGVSRGKQAGIASGERGIKAVMRNLIRRHDVEAGETVEWIAARQGSYDAKLKLWGGIDTFAKRPREVLAECDAAGKGRSGDVPACRSGWAREDVRVGAICA